MTEFYPKSCQLITQLLKDEYIAQGHNLTGSAVESLVTIFENGALITKGNFYMQFQERITGQGGKMPPTEIGADGKIHFPVLEWNRSHRAIYHLLPATATVQ